MFNFHYRTHKILIGVLAFVILVSPQGRAQTDASGVEDIVKKSTDSIVLIGALNQKGTSFGSGFIVSSHGFILTNLHVVKNAMKIEVKIKKNKPHLTAILVGSDAKKDIAVLKVDGERLTPVVLGNSDTVQVGERVVAIGNPLGLENTVSDGLISSIRDTGRNGKVLQITAPVSPGSSGCPLFNLKGEVVGIAVGTIVQGQNINFAIPINYAKKILPSERLPRKEESKRQSLKSSAGVVETAPYIVKPKDTLFDLARKFDTTAKTLMDINQLSDTTIFVGQMIKVPKGK